MRPSMQRQRSFKFNHYDFELPDVELSEIADLKPHHFVKLFLDAQCTLDQEPEFYDRGMMTTAYLHLLRDAGNSNSLPNGTSFLNIVQRWKDDQYWDQKHLAFVTALFSRGLAKQPQVSQAEKMPGIPTGPRRLSSDLWPPPRHVTGDEARPAIVRRASQAETLGVSMQIAGETFALPIIKGKAIYEMTYSYFVDRLNESNPFYMRKYATREDLLYAYKDWILLHFGKTATIFDQVKACLRIDVHLDPDVFHYYRKDLDRILAKDAHGSSIKGRALRNEPLTTPASKRDLFSRIEGLPGKKPHEEALKSGEASLKSPTRSPIRRTHTLEDGEILGTAKSDLISRKESFSSRRTDEGSLESSRNDRKSHVGSPGKRAHTPDSDETFRVEKADPTSRTGSFSSKRARTIDQENSDTRCKVEPSPKRHRTVVPPHSPPTRAVAITSEIPTPSKTGTPSPKAKPSDIDLSKARETPIPMRSNNGLVINTNNPQSYFPSTAPMTAPLPLSLKEGSGLENARARSASISAGGEAGAVPAPAPAPVSASDSVLASEEDSDTTPVSEAVPIPMPTSVPAPAKLESAGGLSNNVAPATPTHPPLLVRVKLLEESLATARTEIAALKKDRAKDQEAARFKENCFADLSRRVGAVERDHVDYQKAARSKEDRLLDLDQRMDSLERAKDKSMADNIRDILARITSLETELRGG